jgi:hypothetical protein
VKSLNVNMLIVVAVSVAVLAMPNAASAQPDLNCNTKYFVGTYHNVTVPGGSMCELIDVCPGSA